MKNGFIGFKLGISTVLFFLTTILYAGSPVLTFTPLTPTTLTISPAMVENVIYTVTNQSNKPHTFVLKALPPGIQQITTGGNCPNPIILAGHQSCTLNLLIVGALLQGNVVGGPVACERGNSLQCYDPCANALNININTERFSVSGIVSGLNGTIILNQDDDFITLSTNGPFTFPTFLFNGESYEVTVQSEPGNQSCTPVINSDGTINGANVTNVEVNCVTSDYSVGVNVSGFTGGTLVLQNNGGDNLNIPGNGFFNFSTLLPQGAPYHVTVLTQPVGLTCSVTNSNGFIDNADITNINVMCSAASQTVGGNVGGFTGGTLVLQNNMGDNLTILGNGPFTFANPVAEGATYSVTILTQPSSQICEVVSGTGTVGNTPVTSVIVNCVTPVAPTTIVASVDKLALSVKNTAFDPTLTGKPRVITITNTGANPAQNVDVRPGLFPAGTTSSHNCPATLNAGASCTITITPGANATSTCTSSTTAPYPAFISVHPDNAPFVTTEILVLSFGCIYQQGYMYSVNDTTPASGSIGGKVIATVDQAARGPGGIFWSSGNTGMYDAGVPIYGINDISTPGSPSPSIGQVAGQIGCTGKSDGRCNSNNILAYYTPLGVNLTYYAAGLCKNYNSGDSNLNWYLPSFCEMAPSTMAAPYNCAANTSNVVSNVPQLIGDTTNPGTSCLIGHDCLGGNYWSSTQSSLDARDGAWYVNFKINNGGSANFTTTKGMAQGVRCSRIF